MAARRGELGAVLVLLVAGCAPAPAPTRPLPSLGQLQSRLPAATQPATQPAAGVARVLRLDFAWDTDLAPAWQLAAPAALPAEMVEAWRANGVRVGMIPAAKLSAFDQALPRPLGGERSRLALETQWAPLALTPMLSATARVQMTLPPFAPQMVTLEPGRTQFLLRLTPAALGPRLEMAPHQHVPKVTLTPRPPQDKALDGRIYEELTLSVALGPEEVLVIGLEPVAPSPDASQPAPTVQPANTVEAPTTAPAEPPRPKPVLPERLGTLLLAATRQGRPVQMLVIVRVGSP